MEVADGSSGRREVTNVQDRPTRRRYGASMSDTAAQIETMAANLADKTGRTLDEWVALARAQGFDKHGHIIGYLKSEHGLTHGYANLVATEARRQPATEVDHVAAQYTGPKAALRPLYEDVIASALALGPDVEVAPKKTYVSLRRSKQFALVKPATRSQLEIGLNLAGEPGTDRLRPATGMCSHSVRIGAAEELDDELRGWIEAAYRRA